MSFTYETFTQWMDDGRPPRLDITNLYLQHSELVSLPECIGELKNVQNLYLHVNKLTSLPKSISELKSLKILCLSNNKFSTIPECIRELKELECLEIVSNRLIRLPKWIEELEKLNCLLYQEPIDDTQWWISGVNITEFRNKYNKARRIRAQKKIYFWIIPILYRPGSESAKRLAEKSWQTMSKEMESFLGSF